MGKTFDQGKGEIEGLCKYFTTNRGAFHAPGVKEAHIRQTLIDPFFEALGWDVHNAARLAPQYREVIPEDSLEVAGRQKAPDYNFRVGTTSKFFAEAKKCGVSVHEDPAPAYQLRRYGWNAKLPISILTDFEEFSVYDCTQRPRESDKASALRTLYMECAQYPDRWRELWDIFSREAVWSGAFDQYTASKRSKRGTSEVDAEFLRDIERWRDELARHLAPQTRLVKSEDDLNRLVQLTIDRIVFLRMAEDRGLERENALLDLCREPDIYPRFIALCRKADDKYNSGLFHFQKEPGVSEGPDEETPRLKVEDRVLKPILQGLYFEHDSPYDFRVMPVEILGTVYERFLGKVIRITEGHHAKVEEKPEVRKAGGVYYTPAYIVDYIVKKTVVRQIEGRSPAQLSGKGKGQRPFRVLDMACGSGSFLLGAYQCLLDHYLGWYTENSPERYKDATYQDGRTRVAARREGDWRLTITEKKRILSTHIFGVDIDHQAVEVTKLSLLLKVLEGENDVTFQQNVLFHPERALPNLAENIKCGNSLIGADYFTGKLTPDAEELKRVNPFDWKKEFPAAMADGGFDCVIGNPPYGAFVTEEQTEYLGHNYQTQGKDIDTYALFMDKSVRLSKPGGMISMIVPTGWYSGAKFTRLRMFVATKTDPESFVNLPYDVFEAWVDTTIFVTQKRVKETNWPRKETCKVKIRTFPKRHRIISSSEFDQGIKTVDFSEWFTKGNDEYLTYADAKATALLQNIQARTRPFSEFADIQRGVTPFKLTPSRTHSTSTRAFAGTVRRYVLESGPIRYIRFDDTILEPKPARYFEGPRLLLRELISRQFRLQAAKATRDFVTNKSMQSILQSSNGPDLNYLLGVLNSRLLSWFFLHRSNIAQRDDFPKIVLKETRSLPIRPINFKNPADKSRHDCMVALVENMLTLHKQLAEAKSEAERTVIQRQVESTDAEIDGLVYELYGLTQEEIKIIEEHKS